MKLERCPRGLRSTLGKRVCVKAHRGFESHPLRTERGEKLAQLIGLAWRDESEAAVEPAANRRPGSNEIALAILARGESHPLRTERGEKLAQLIGLAWRDESEAAVEPAANRRPGSNEIALAILARGESHSLRMK